MRYPTALLFVSLTLIFFIASHVVGQTTGSGGDRSDDNGRALQVTARDVPNAGDHPGNVFLQGQTVRIDTPATSRESDAQKTTTHATTQWRVSDELDREIARGIVEAPAAGPVALGKLPVGWYHIGWLDSTEKEVAWTTAAVLAPLAAPTPQDSPVCIDSATAWFAKDDPVKQEHLSRLAALAGVNWIRDRMRWRDIQPTENRVIDNTTYDTSADIEHRFGLKVLQVFHDTPPWAAAERRATGRRATGRRATGRFPTDLRHIYRFAHAMSQRYRGRVQAWEPWNEANVATFGGHTINEICAYQKAAYLGFKAGDPEVTVCWNVTTAVPTERQTDGILLNEAWSYFDTYNIHTYDWADEYQRLWKPARRAACGKPLWITESDRGIAAEPSSPTSDLSATNQRLKAEYVSQSYVQSLHAGADRHFHFILGQYGEGETQFGLLRHDMTPRPGYVALAALGRLLAGARCLGRYEQPDNPDLHVYALHARPDGEERDVLVAWAEKNVDWHARGKTAQHWTLPDGLVIERAFDYLGRPQTLEDEILLKSAPTFLVLPSGQCNALPLTRPDVADRRVDAPGTTVLQCVMPKGSAVKMDRIPWASEYEYAITPGRKHPISLFLYNFGDQVIRGSVRIERAPEQCKVQPRQWQVELQPMERHELIADITVPGTMTNDKDDTWILLRGDFGPKNQPVVAFRLVAKP